MKLLARILLIVTLFLAGGNPYWDAPSQQSSRHIATCHANQLLQVSPPVATLHHEGPATIRSATSGDDDEKSPENNEPQEEDEDEDEKSATRRISASAHFFTTTFLGRAVPFSACFISTLPFCEHLAAASPDRCVQLGVFRI
ncbi:MAG: hypothetical protein JNL72_08215 [Flavipsychrobacter sp.]|nr:hypothetical protein [Flavipsychrobacter sp.]